MEAWFAADPWALIKHLGQDFRSNVLPSPQSAEATPVRDLTAAISNGLRPYSSRRSGYDKVRDGVELPQLIDETTVGTYGRHFSRLMNFLSQSI